MKIESILAMKGLKVITVRPDQSLKDAVDLLVEHDIGALIVVDELGQPVGIISERDIIREAARSETVLARTVAQVMTKDLIVAAPQDDLGAVLQTMIARRFRHMPIVDQERLIGSSPLGMCSQCNSTSIKERLIRSRLRSVKVRTDSARPCFATPTDTQPHMSI